MRKEEHGNEKRDDKKRCEVIRKAGIKEVTEERRKLGV